MKHEGSIFHAIRGRGPFLLHHPYHSFPTSVERFLREASADPKVRAIKMTLYRTSATTNVIDYFGQCSQKREAGCAPCWNSRRGSMKRQTFAGRTASRRRAFTLPTASWD